MRGTLTYSQVEMLQALNDKGGIEDKSLHTYQRRSMICLENRLLAERVKDENDQDVWHPLYTIDGELLGEDRY